MKQMNIFLHVFKIILFSGILVATASARAELKVVTTIKPLHSLISNVMDGVGEPSLIIEGSTSPHSFVLKPSHAKMIEQADIIFWIGEDIETFMEKPLESIAKNAKKISFMELTSIEKLKFREEDSCFIPHKAHQDTLSIGSCNGVFDLKNILKTKKVKVTTIYNTRGGFDTTCVEGKIG